MSATDNSPLNERSAGTGQSASGAGQEPFAPFEPLSETPVRDFPVQALPGSLRDFVIAEAEATQTPLDLAGLLSLGAIATACAKRVVVEVREGWREQVNVFVALAQPPGSRKSQVLPTWLLRSQSGRAEKPSGCDRL